MSDKETAPRVDNRPCDDCGNENPVWFADNEVWNAAVPERVGYICPNCFIRRADSKIRTTGWKLVPEVAAECTAPAPQPAQRSDKDYAIEHAEYLAKAAEHLMDEINKYDMADLAGDECDSDARSDAWNSLRSAIGEFRKRAKRAATPQVTPTKDNSDQ